MAYVSKEQLVQHLVSSRDTSKFRVKILDHLLEDTELFSLMRLTALRDALPELIPGQTFQVVLCHQLICSEKGWTSRLAGIWHLTRHCAALNEPRGEGGMDPILSSLSEPQLSLVERALYIDDDENISDDELIKYFVDSGLTEEQAERAISYRDLYQVSDYFHPYTPIRAGKQALRRDPAL